ncbi:hypothetical protein V5H41_29755, partial [Salmonella enterica]
LRGIFYTQRQGMSLVLGKFIQEIIHAAAKKTAEPKTSGNILYTTTGDVVSLREIYPGNNSRCR